MKKKIYDLKNLIIQTQSIKNIRPHNEDELYFNIYNNNSNIQLLCVFDGHGGNYVSKNLLDLIPKYILKDECIYGRDKNKNINSKIIKYFEVIQESLKEKKYSINMGSTALIAIIYIDSNKLKLKIINLGDSRIICCNKYNIGIPLSKDHKPDFFEEKLRITNMGGEVTYRENDCPRIKGLATSRSFGDLDTKPYVSHIPDIFDYDDISKMKYLVLACDGIWDVLSCQEAVDYVMENIIIEKKLENKSEKSKNNNIAYRLAEYALKKGSQDNLSVIIIFFI